jgi:hypothetical protein
LLRVIAEDGSVLTPGSFSAALEDASLSRKPHKAACNVHCWQILLQKSKIEQPQKSRES